MSKTLKINDILEKKKQNKTKKEINTTASKHNVKRAIKAYDKYVRNLDENICQSQHLRTAEFIIEIFADHFNSEASQTAICQYNALKTDRFGNRVSCPQILSNGAAIASRLNIHDVVTIDRHMARLQETKLFWSEKIYKEGNVNLTSGQVDTLRIAIHPDLLAYRSVTESEAINRLRMKPIVKFLEKELKLKAIQKIGKEKYYYAPWDTIRNQPSLKVNTTKNVWYDSQIKDGGGYLEMLSMIA